MKDYRNRINRLKIEIEDLEYKIALAVSQNRSAFAKRLNIMLERQKQKLEKWISL